MGAWQGSRALDLLGRRQAVDCVSGRGAETPAALHSVVYPSHKKHSLIAICHTLEAQQIPHGTNSNKDAVPSGSQHDAPWPGSLEQSRKTAGRFEAV